MNRDQFKNTVRQIAVREAPNMAAFAVEELIESQALKRFFDNRARKRPRGIVARFRAWRNGVPLDEQEKKQLAEYVRMMAERKRPGG